jgi:hypothetical protein
MNAQEDIDPHTQHAVSIHEAIERRPNLRIVSATDLRPGDSFRFVAFGERFGDRIQFVRKTAPMHDGRTSCLTVDMRDAYDRRTVETMDATDKVLVGFTSRRAKHRRRNMRRAERKREAKAS